MKRILIITSTTIVCLLAIFAYLAFGNVHYHYHKVITEPLAKIGVANAQYKMGECYYELFLYPPDESKAKEKLDKAIYWWSLAATKGHKAAITALAEAEKMLEDRENNTDDAEYEASVEVAKATVAQFRKLLKERKHEEALDFYLKEQASFFIAFELTTAHFEFHNDIIIPMLFQYKDDSTAYKEVIHILETEQITAEAVIAFSDGKNIPTHYGTLLSDLGQMYIDVERYADALALTDKMFKIAKEMNEQALVYYNQAYIYKLMGNKESALESAEMAISVLEAFKLQDGKLYNDCLQIIAEININK